jgi:hypothetical protein
MLSCVMGTSTLSAHPADVSQLRVHVEHERIEFRFTINVAAISRVVRIDSNHDNQITFSEITAAVPIMRDFLTRTTLVTINNESANLGDFVKNECFWPHPETSTITPQEEGTRFVDFNFTKPWPKGVEDVWLGFKVFEQLGDLHVIQCLYQQPGQHDTPVDFTATEPEYLYDTGWAAADTVKPSITDKTSSGKQAEATIRNYWMLPGSVLGTLLIILSAHWWQKRRPRQGADPKIN